VNPRSVRGVLAVAIVILALWSMPLGSRAPGLGGQPAPSLAAGASPVPSESPRTSAPITVTASDVTIDGVAISSASSDGIGIAVEGTAARPIRNITIRNCVVRGFATGIEIRHAENVVIDNCTVTDADYAGIAGYSMVGGRISDNTVERIGMNRTDMTVEGQLNNAYGITLDRFAPGSFTTDPRSADVAIEHNVVEDVPLWMGINTHAGQGLTISSNIVRRTPRAIFVAGDDLGNPPIDVDITNNRVEEPVTKPGGTDDIQGILISHLQGGSITDNAVARAYGSPDGIDYQGASTDITRSGNYRI
jgi:hypothetical protein